MPEFPEVHTVIGVLEEFTLGKTITSVDVLRDKTIEGNVEEFKNTVKGATIQSFEQKGKFIIFHLSNKHVIVSHLRMEGKYFLKDEDEKLTKHDLVTFHFSDGTKLLYNDTRRFGTMSVKTDENYLKVPPLSNVGPNPFELKDAKHLEKNFKNKSLAIKTALLDQSIMSGLGNIYVDEVLFATKVHPETPAKMIGLKKLNEILLASQKTLQKAIDAGGSTIKSYHPKEGIDGNFQVQLEVYGKKDECCPRCGSKFRKIFVNGRGTTYCPKCQKNPGIPVVFGVTGPIGSGKSTVSELIAKRGFKHLDCDAIVHDLYKTKDLQNKLKRIIPELEIVNGDIDRKWLKLYLIENPKKKLQLQKIVHKEVVDFIEKQIKKSKQNVVIEAAFLFETDIALICDKTFFVKASKEKQIENLIARGDDVEKALKLNANFDDKNIKKATHVINNDADVANLDKQLDIIFGK